MEPKLSKEDKKRIGDLVRTHLRENLVRKAQDKSGNTNYICSPSELAFEARVSQSTIFKMHSGDFSLKSLRLVQGILGVDFLSQEGAENVDARTKRPSGEVTVELGGYTEDQIAPYIGRYITVRRGTTVPDNLLTTIVDISWDTELQGARFHETNKFTSSHGRELDYSQSGTVHQSSQIGVLHLLTSFKGALRLITLTRLQVMEPVMYGAILTQVPEAGNFVPARATVHFRKVSEKDTEYLRARIGVITPNHPAFETLNSDLEEARGATLAR